MKKLLTIMLAVLLAALAVAASAEDNVKNADIIIVGAGGGGLSAAIEAVNDGAQSVIVLEKTGKTGGSLNFTSGSMSGAETVIQKIDGIEDTKESFVQDILNNGAHLGNEAMIRAFVDEDVDAIQWLWDNGLSEYNFSSMKTTGKHTVFAPEHQLYSVARTYKPSANDPTRYKAAAHEIMDTVLATDAYKGVTIDFNTTANQLVANEQGQVLTVLATDENGQTVRYEAKKAVIMATGGYSGNAKMMSAFAKNGANYLVGGSTAADGYGIYMMQQVGANIDPTAMGYIPTFPMGHETAPGMGVIASSYMWKAGGISVNQEGFRFANENDADVVARETALEEQTNAIQYDIFTDKIIEDTEALNASVFWNFYYAPGMGVIASSYMWKAGGISVNQEGFRFANENDADVVARETALEEQTNAIQYDIFTDKIIEDTEALNASVFWNFYYAPGKPYNSAVVSADSLAVLAEKLGIPAANLEATVKSYNEHVESGEPDEFGREYTEDAIKNNSAYCAAINKIEGEHYYAIPLKALVVMTLGGVSTNTDGQVLDVDGAVIPGLYAAGECVGGIWGRFVSGGTGVMGPIVFGRLAARAAMATEPATGYTLKTPAAVITEDMFAKDADSAESLFDMSQTLADGEYEATVDGQEGPMTVKVTVADGKIAAVVVAENHETQAVAAAALEKVPQAIVDANSVDVDGVSGATLTSGRIKDAAVKCLTQAAQ